ncbi:hypothetical protein LYNGBM3L_51950 [Moorena producens 3L]|uniref:S-layer family protein n=1 Tax=Moorena producens 3L TaxID=489825 RepID=F4XQJ1_9CYAN|nr:hypothetical protein [Moorena producens]EGJ33144.1 hypothetical protein LYNGBM3L_51950 [Moorena producens 3L]OLT54211.1 hypothetical protein BI334_32910 [Moorena producens 3L]
MAGNNITLTGGVIAVDTAADINDDELRDAGSIRLSAQSISLNNQAAISSSSTGNVAAGSIAIDIRDDLQLTDAQITSSADNADAGDIVINTTQMFMDNSLVTTSVSNDGDGGNIVIASDFILMENGFIQGNTGGADFSGGNISIGADFLIVSEQSLLTGGEERLVFVPSSGVNVIQAAAPDGVSGVVNIGALEFDLSDELASIGAEVLQLDNLDNNPCNSSSASTLANTGKGGLAQQPEDFNSPILHSEAIKLRLGTQTSAQLDWKADTSTTRETEDYWRQCQKTASHFYTGIRRTMRLLKIKSPRCLNCLLLWSVATLAPISVAQEVVPNPAELRPALPKFVTQENQDGFTLPQVKISPDETTPRSRAFS